MYDELISDTNMVLEPKPTLTELKMVNPSEISEWREYKDVENRSVGFNKFIIESLVRKSIKRA